MHSLRCGAAVGTSIDALPEVVVTGGLGFIGSHVVDAYLAAGHRVRIIDSAVGAVTDGREYDEDPRCQLFRVSVEDYLRDGGTFAGSDRVIHAAAHVGPAGILRFVGRLGADIVRSTSCVIEDCLAHGLALCVFSSAEVYGRSGLLGERDDIRVPTNYNARIEYAIAKTLTEAMAVNSGHRGLRAIVIRPFNVAGPRQSRAGGFVLPTFVQQALVGKPMTVFAGGGQVRAFLSATDLTRFLIEYLDPALKSSKRIYNIGNPANRTTILELAQRVKTLLGSPSEIVHVDATQIHGPLYAEAESYEKMPVLSNASELGWQPRVTLDELILETAAFYRERRDMRAGNAPL
jgi:nucleoside-diphosphate-sugar epimerase